MGSIISLAAPVGVDDLLPCNIIFVGGGAVGRTYPFILMIIFCRSMGGVSSSEQPSFCRDGIVTSRSSPAKPPLSPSLSPRRWRSNCYHHSCHRPDERRRVCHAAHHRPRGQRWGSPVPRGSSQSTGEANSGRMSTFMDIDLNETAEH